jgi:uncharacterized membrane protein YgaE (UPF0421/DUF939 family)
MSFEHRINTLKTISVRLGLSLLIFKTALAAGISWWLATGIFQTHYPFFAPLAAILTVQVTVADSLQKASQRIIGIVLGVIISMLIGKWVDLGPFSIFLVIFSGMTIFNALKMNAQIISQVAVSSFLVLAFGQENDYAIERIFETILGSGIAVAINALIVPSNSVGDMENKIAGLSKVSSNTLKGLVPAFKAKIINHKSGKAEVQKLVDETVKTVQSLKVAQQSLKYTPFLSRVRRKLYELEVYLIKLEYMTVQIRGIRRGLVDLHLAKAVDNELFRSKDLDDAITATAECITLFGQAVVDERQRALLEQQKERAMLAQDKCLAKIKSGDTPVVVRDLGAILTDLNRILNEAEL